MSDEPAARAGRASEGDAESADRSTRWESIVAGAAGILLVLALAGDAALVEVALSFHKKATLLRLDPSGAKMFGAPAAPRAPDTHVLVLFGDSRAAMWPAPEVPAGFEVVNRGIGYQTTAQLVLRLDADVLRLRPGVVVIEAGVNDLRAIAEFPAMHGAIVADCEANLERIVARSVDGGATVLLATVFDVGDVPLWRRPFWSDDVRTAVNEVNAFLRTLARDKVIVWDANAVLVGEDGRVRAPYQVDYLHITPPGYAALNVKLGAMLRALPAAPAPLR